MKNKEPVLKWNVLMTGSIGLRENFFKTIFLRKIVWFHGMVGIYPINILIQFLHKLVQDIKLYLYQVLDLNIEILKNMKINVFKKF